MSYAERFETVDIDYDEIEHTTDKAVLVIIEGEEFWIPLSTIKNDYLEDGFIRVPQWLVDEKGLL